MTLILIERHGPLTEGACGLSWFAYYEDGMHLFAGRKDDD